MSSVSFLGAFAFAVGGGVTTFFAPCAFPLLPGYIGYYLSQTDADRPTEVALPAFAAAGSALAVLAVIGGIGFALGQVVLRHLPLLEPLVGAGLVILGGLMLVGLTPNMHIPLPERPGSALGFSLFGAGYAGAAAGCVVPILLGVLAQALAFPPAQAVIIFGGYALSVALPLVGVTLLAATGSDAWREIGRYTDHLHRVAAILMILAGIGQLYLSIIILDVLELPKLSIMFLI
jgi:cytochrome c-type biogenesis protein